MFKEEENLEETEKRRSGVKDPVSGFTHTAGAVGSIAALVLLAYSAAKYGELPWDVVSFTIFGASLILLYTFSSLHHLLNLQETGTRVMRKFDHIMIYILIAGSYTPICLGPLRGGWGWSVFGVVWGIAILGIVLTASYKKTPRVLRTGTYIFMGWVCLVAIYPMIKAFNEAGALSSLWWLLAGGIFYTIGGVIYALKWPKIENKYFGFHEIFHIFVMLASFCHFWFVFKYLVLI